MENKGKSISKFAIAGLALGVLGFFNYSGVEKAAAAIVFGILGLYEIKRNSENLTGKSIAVSAVVLGAVIIAMLIFYLSFKAKIDNL